MAYAYPNEHFPCGGDVGGRTPRPAFGILDVIPGMLPVFRVPSWLVVVVCHPPHHLLRYQSVHLAARIHQKSFQKFFGSRKPTTFTCSHPALPLRIWTRLPRFIFKTASFASSGSIIWLCFKSGLAEA